MTALSRDLTNLIGTISSNGVWTDSVSYGGYHQQSNENEHLFEVPLVGVKREDVNVDIQDNVLTISATVDVKSRFVRNFKQCWNLTKDSNVDAVSANLENGLLTVRIPRVKPAKKTVNITVT